MKIFDTRDIKEIDAFTIKNEPISSVDLMERAAEGCALWINNRYTKDQTFTVFTGSGNNGGDGWAIARILTDRGYSNIRLYHLEISSSISPDLKINQSRLTRQGKVAIHMIRSIADFPIPEPESILIDALFGSGLNRPLEGIAANLVAHLNTSGCPIISIDLPSGLMGEVNQPENKVIRAQHTLTFQFPKRAFFYIENSAHTGDWHIIDIGLHAKVIHEKHSDFHYLTFEEISGKIRKRSRFSHKGVFGHALLLAGSYGMAGAAILAARACIRSGTGLLTTHLPGLCYPIAQAVVPESIFSIDKNPEVFSTLPEIEKYTAIGVGPGLGTADITAVALNNLINNSNIPMVLDADALNILAMHSGLIAELPENSIITPHPGEFDRLFGKSENGLMRNMLQIEKSKEYKVIIILKGAYSSITLPDGTCYFNSTGNPGMATGGSGDVLTGIILSLLSQKLTPVDAALTGTFLHGLAGDLAAEEKGQQSLIASDIIDNLNVGFKKIREYET